MNSLCVQNQFKIFNDINGKPLDEGYVWIGAANQNPVTSPISVFWDEGLTVAATQPIRTRGGYPLNGSSIGNLYTATDYSIRVTNKNGSVLYNVASVSLGSISVKDFGAVGDGVTDDTAAIQAAHNTGLPVYYPSGDYRVVSQITLSGIPFAMYGEGAARIVTGTDNLATLFSVTNAPRVLVSGIRFDANNLGKGFLLISGCPDVQITQSDFRNFKNDPVTAGNFSAVLIRYCPNARITNNTFENIGQNFGGSGAQPPQYRSITQEAGCDRSVVSDNVFNGVFGAWFVAEFARWASGASYVTNDRVHFFDGTQFNLYRCTANNTASVANQPPNASFWSLERSNTFPIEACTFSGNICRNVRDNSVYAIEYVKSVTVTGNTFVAANDESIVVVCENATITGNTFLNTKNKAISLELGIAPINSVAISGNSFIQDDANFSIGNFIVYRNAAATNKVGALSITGNNFKSAFSIAPGSYLVLRHCGLLNISNNVFDVASVADERVIRTFNQVDRGIIANNVFLTASTTAIPFGNDSTGSDILVTGNMMNGRILANSTQEIVQLGLMQDTGSNIYIQEPVNKVIWGNAAPTTGAWRRGDIVWNATPANNSATGWTCVSAGSPGTWGTIGTAGNLTVGAGWQPTLTNVTNIDASTASFANYSQVGNTVCFSGQLTVDPTATGSVSLRISLPIAMDFTATRQAAGVVSSSNGSIVGSINADNTNNELLLTANATTTSNTTIQYSGTYTLA